LIQINRSHIHIAAPENWVYARGARPRNTTRSITSMFAIMAVEANGAVPQVGNTRSILTAPSAKDPGAGLQATRAFTSVPRFEPQSFKVRGDFYADQPVLRRVAVFER
jgi:hypothetical protein